MFVHTYIRPSVCSFFRSSVQKVIYCWIFSLFSLPLICLFSLVSFFFTPSSVASSSSSVCRHRMSPSCRARSTGQERRRAIFFFFFIPRSLLRAFENPSGEGARESAPPFYIPHTREYVTGVNQSMSPGIRLYSTPKAWMTSRGFRDGARCARMTRDTLVYFASYTSLGLPSFQISLKYYVVLLKILRCIIKNYLLNSFYVYFTILYIRLCFNLNELFFLFNYYFFNLLLKCYFILFQLK